MLAQSRKARKKKRKVLDKPLTAAQKRKFVQTFNQIKLQITDLEKVAFSVSFFHI
jgi:hypothetical protein